MLVLKHHMAFNVFALITTLEIHANIQRTVVVVATLMLNALKEIVYACPSSVVMAMYVKLYLNAILIHV